MERSDTIQSVERAFAVLRAIALHGASVPLALVAKETGLPKSTVSRLLSTMVGVGVVDRVSEGLYSIGPEMRAIVQPAVGVAELSAIARPYLRQMVDRVGEDAGLAVPDGHSVLYVGQVQGSHPVQVQDWTGQRFAAHTTAAGYVLLGGLEIEALDSFLAGDLEKATAATVVEPTLLKSLIQSAAAEGIAWPYEAWAEGINGAAAPIRDASGRIVAAINLYGPSYRFPGDADQEAIGRHLIEAAEMVSRHLGSGAP